MIGNPRISYHCKSYMQWHVWLKARAHRKTAVHTLTYMFPLTLIISYLTYHKYHRYLFCDPCWKHLVKTGCMSQLSALGCHYLRTHNHSSTTLEKSIPCIPDRTCPVRREQLRTYASALNASRLGFLSNPGEFLMLPPSSVLKCIENHRKSIKKYKKV